MATAKNEGYISWQDVFQLWEQVERETNTVIELSGRGVHALKGKGVISGCMVAYARDSPNERGEEVSRVWYSFPHGQHASFPGLLVNRLYAVMEYVERTKKAKELAQSALPF